MQRSSILLRQHAGSSISRWHPPPLWSGFSAVNTAVQRPTAATVRSFSAVAAPIFHATYDQTVDSFPSIVIGANNKLEAQGSFAQNQAAYLSPDPMAVHELTQLLRDTRTGIVAHYYMDVELQGVLQAVARNLPPGRVGVADSLKMGDLAVDMCGQDPDLQAIVCLGVDFMSESVQAILRKQNMSVPVYRAAQAKIGCSLAESAERDAYRAWLQKESNGEAALHVIYINTSLETKATSSSLVPTITCTSSNVLQTILQASAQMGPQLKILYGPDTYMGDNLVTLFSTILHSWDDARIAKELHPQHNRASLTNLRDRMNVFPSGNCIVHHMFGASVVDLVKSEYQDCYVTAHLEVPGEMFEIAMQKSLTDEGVVGSTSNILQFISRKVQEAAAKSKRQERLRFILGTEAGMVTSIVHSVQQILQDNNSHIEAEIIFPVAQEAVTATDDGDLTLVPGVAGGEGCSTAGGCATCPFMKMNDLDALMDVLMLVKDDNQTQLRKHLPPNRLQGQRINNRDATELGSEAILYMREFMQTKQISDELCQKVMAQKHTRALING